MKLGDQFVQQFGPYRAVATVVKVTDRGAVLEYQPNAVLVGFEHPIIAPDGTELTKDAAHGFLGRAHWPGVEVINP